MFDRIFPKQIDNTDRGQRLAVWLFVPVVFIELSIGANCIINTRAVAMLADGIPLDRYSAGGADAVIALFAIVGLFHVLLAVQGAVALVRYRAMIPFMYLLLLILQSGSKALLLMYPVAKSGVFSSQLGAAFNLAFLAMLLIGFVLSLLDKPDSALAK